MEKIDFNDSKTVSHWEERIARFMGIDTSPDNYFMGIQPFPEYSTSLPDLFRVLGEISNRTKALSETVTRPDNIGQKHMARIWADIQWGCFFGEGDTPESAIFQAVCQYLRHYHPTVGEEQEKIERNSQ